MFAGLTNASSVVHVAGGGEAGDSNQSNPVTHA
jgi:hypothetical protein